MSSSSVERPAPSEHHASAAPATGSIVRRDGDGATAAATETRATRGAKKAGARKTGTGKGGSARKSKTATAGAGKAATTKAAGKKAAGKKAAGKKGATGKVTTKKGGAKKGGAKKGSASKVTARKGAATKTRTRRTASPKRAPARKRAARPTPPGTEPLTKPVLRTKPFALKPSPIAGRGAFATRDIPKEARIAEYFGRRITPEEADDLYPYPDDPSVPHHTFLFNLDEHTVLDGSVDGDSSRFINHSCEPNCEAVIEDSRIFIETLRDIRKGEELLYDYQFVLDEPHTAEAKERYPCHCGSARCRGTILAKKKR